MYVHSLSSGWEPGEACIGTYLLTSIIYVQLMQTLMSVLWELMHALMMLLALILKEVMSAFVILGTLEMELTAQVSPV